MDENTYTYTNLLFLPYYVLCFIGGVLIQTLSANAQVTGTKRLR